MAAMVELRGRQVFEHGDGERPGEADARAKLLATRPQLIMSAKVCPKPKHQATVVLWLSVTQLNILFYLRYLKSLCTYNFPSLRGLENLRCNPSGAPIEMPEAILDDISHRRYNPLRGSWLLVSPHRTKRPWQ